MATPSKSLVISTELDEAFAYMCVHMFPGFNLNIAVVKGFIRPLQNLNGFTIPTPKDNSERTPVLLLLVYLLYHFSL